MYPAPPFTSQSDPRCTDTPASEVSRKDSESSKTTGTTVGSVAGDSSGPVNDTQKKIHRTERFDVLVKLSEQEKRNSRAERCGSLTQMMETLVSCSFKVDTVLLHFALGLAELRAVSRSHI